MESYLSDRNAPTSNSQHLEEVAEFLRQVQNAQKNHVLIIAMTNMYEKIDPAILRRGRFDHHIEVGLPSEENGLDAITADSIQTAVSHLPKEEQRRRIGF